MLVIALWRMKSSRATFQERWVAGGTVEAVIIHGFEQAEAEVAFPEPVDDGLGEARIRGIDQQRRHVMEALIERLGNFVRGVGKIEGKRGFNKMAAVLFASDEFEVIRGEQAGECGEAGLRPFLVEEMIVAACAFGAGAKKYLRGIGGGLDGVDDGFGCERNR